MTQFRLVGLSILLVLFLSGCDLTKDYIPVSDMSAGEINQHAAELNTKTVWLSGKVTGSTKIPLMNSSYYSVESGGDSLSVETKGSLPVIGSKVRVSGVVTNVAVIQGKGIGVHLKEKKRLPAYSF